MENAKKVNPTKETDERVKNDTWGSSCSFWIFGDKDVPSGKMLRYYWYVVKD